VADTNGGMRAQLRALGSFHMKESIQESSWKSYATGIRHWIRFRLGVQGRHPLQTIAGSNPLELEFDAEDSLIEFLEWISLAGTVAPSTAGDYISAVKAAHLLWVGYPYESISKVRFFRLARVLSGLRKTSSIRKNVLREGLQHAHFGAIFELHDRLIPNSILSVGETSAHESVLVVPWQAILRPAEVIVTEGNPTPANWSWITFRDAFRQVVPYSTDYNDIELVELDLLGGRKNDANRENPPIILAADHEAHSRRFCACFQLHRAINFMAPHPSILPSIPLFPMKLIPNIGNNMHHGMRSFTDSELTKMIRLKLSIVWGCTLKDPSLAPYTGYSLRIGGAVALHDAGADGMVIAALGQWRSDVYQIYIRTARHKAMAWTIRMSRGFKAKF
jgi:hypothetical protein